MKSFSLSALALALCCACTPSAKVSCLVSDAPETAILVKHLDLDGFGSTDSLKTDSKGRCRFKVPVEKGRPEFVYLYYKDNKIASLLIEPGQKNIRLTADTLGRYKVDGSDSSEELRRVEQDFAGFSARAAKVTDRGEFVREYVSYYRSRVKYITENPRSMTCIPVLYQKLSTGVPVFSQTTDALHFRRVCDSLKLRYPESKYVKALEKETSRRESAMQLDYMMKNSTPSAYPSIKLPDINGRKVCLDSIDAKVVLVHFWDSADPAQKMFNIDVLMPLYSDFHPKGFEIYSVCLDIDKVRWGTVVGAQKLPWTNVCDGFGAACPAVSAYNVTSLPYSVLVNDNGIAAAPISGEAGLRKELAKLL